MFINKIGVLILFIMFFLTTQVEGTIYICVDSKGVKHYSDKKCPVEKTVKTEIIDDLGKTTIPNSILEFTPIIQTVKRALRLIQEQIPDNELYQRAYNYSVIAEKYHNNYIATKHNTHPKKYNPFEPITLENVIAAISHACRVEAYMTVCGVVEGNYWLNGEEQIYLKNQMNKGTQVRITAANKKLFCEKAKLASNGGVISRKMVNYFCQVN